MKRSALALLLCMALASVGIAQQNSADTPASTEDIEQYLKVIHSSDNMRNTLEAMAKPLHQMIHEQMAKIPNLPRDAEARQIKMVDDMVKSFPVDELQQALVPVYQKHLTKGDIAALTAFYSTPTGQKMLKEQPQISAEGMQAVMPIIRKVTAKTMEQVREQIAQLQKQSDANSKNQSQPAPN
jgi:hypothetical protein